MVVTATRPLVRVRSSMAEILAVTPIPDLDLL
jgi:hypothetical protein